MTPKAGAAFNKESVVSAENEAHVLAAADVEVVVSCKEGAISASNLAADGVVTKVDGVVPKADGVAPKENGVDSASEAGGVVSAPKAGETVTSGDAASEPDSSEDTLAASNDTAPKVNEGALAVAAAPKVKVVLGLDAAPKVNEDIA